MQPTNSKRSFWLLLSLSGFLTLAAYLAFVHIPQSKERLIRDWQSRMEVIANDRRAAIEFAIEQSFSEATTFASYPTAVSLASGEAPPREHRAAERWPHLRGLLANAVAVHDYQGLVLIGRNGTVIVETGVTQQPQRVQRLARLVTQSGQPHLEHDGRGDSTAITYFAVPVFTAFDSTHAVGAMVAAVRSGKLFFPPLAARWEGHPSAESLIAERRGDSAFVLLGANKSGAGRVAFPLSATRHPAVRAVIGMEAFGEMTDYSDASVFAVTRKLRNAPWGIVIKIDRHVALAPYRRELTDLAGMLLGLLIAVVAVASALISRIRAEHVLTLQESRRRFQGLFDNGSVGVASASPEGVILECNHHFAEMLGYEPEELRGMSTHDITPPEDHELQTRRLREYIEGEEDFIVREKRYQRKDGRIIWVRLGAVVIRNEDGSPAYYMAMVDDITERFAAEQALRAAQLERDLIATRARMLLQANMVGIAISTADGAVLEANDAYLDIIGCSRAELQSGAVRWTDITPPEYEPADRRSLAELRLTGRSTPYEKEYLRRDGQRTWVLMCDSLLKEEDNHILTFAVDINKQKSLELQYQQAQKMEAVGRLAGGVAHDFNNILTAIKGIASLARDEVAETDPIGSDLDEISECADRATTLTKQLLAFSRRQVLQPCDFDIRGLVEGLNRMLRRLIGEDIDLQVALPEEALIVHADRSQIEQVILNLAVNARDAMPHGGQLSISAEVVNASEIEGDMSASNGSHRYVSLAVSDSGSGMDIHTMSRIFEPFFTTKEQGKGTGLGLATVYGIVKQSAGVIRVTSTPGAGTTFTVYLPHMDGAIAPVAVQPATPERSDQRGCILLVEDEDSVRALVRRGLERKGHRVVEARNGAEALFAVEQLAGEIDLVITDLVMPGMKGTELVERLRVDQPGLEVLFMSGYSAEFLDQQLMQRGNFIEKPFTPQQLQNRVSEILSAVVPAGTSR